MHRTPADKGTNMGLEDVSTDELSPTERVLLAAQLLDGLDEEVLSEDLAQNHPTSGHASAAGDGYSQVRAALRTCRNTARQLLREFKLTYQDRCMLSVRRCSTILQEPTSLPDPPDPLPDLGWLLEEDLGALRAE